MIQKCIDTSVKSYLVCLLLTLISIFAVCFTALFVHCISTRTSLIGSSEWEREFRSLGGNLQIEIDSTGQKVRTGMGFIVDIVVFCVFCSSWIYDFFTVFMGVWVEVFHYPFLLPFSVEVKWQGLGFRHT